MSISLFATSLPVFQTTLSNLLHCLEKAEAHALARKFEADVYVNLRLAPDMLPSAAQIRIACDVAKNGAARLAGIEAPKFEDNETTFTELKARITKTLNWLGTVPASALDGREEAEITFPVGRDKTRTMQAADYLKQVALPNLYFHTVTAYALLRHNGVDLGKGDFLMGAQASA